MEQTVLLTPGPLTTSETVKEAMQVDLGTRDVVYQDLTQRVRTSLLTLAHASCLVYSCILLQGSGTYGVESVLTSTIRKDEKLLILSNGAYGERMEKICKKARIPYVIKKYSMTSTLPLLEIESEIAQNDITHVAYIHSETTAGVLNDISAIQALIQRYHKISIVDAMSSFASLDIPIEKLGIDYLITSSNKCLHGVPGLAIIFARKQHLDTCQDVACSLSLDLYEQYRFMEDNNGSFRFTSPTHVLLALAQAIQELNESGGIPARNLRYKKLQAQLCETMKSHGFQTLVSANDQSPVITTFLYPKDFDFQCFYDYFKENGFLLYNGKLPGVDAFRIGNIGEISDVDIKRFIKLLNQYEEGNK